MKRVPFLLSGFAAAALVTGSAMPALSAPSDRPRPASRAAGEFCAGLPDLVANRWEGAGVDDPGDDDTGEDADWENDANWSLGLSPLHTPDDDYVCIPGGGQPVIDGAAGQEADVAAFDVEGGARLTVNEGAKLFIDGDQAEQRSTVRRFGVLLLEGGAFGGPGRLDVRGSMFWRSLPTGAASIMTRECSTYSPACGEPVPGPRGRLQVLPTGFLVVDGRGVNLKDEYRIVSLGAVRLMNEAYIAADRGTSLDIGPGGVLDLRNDGGYYEGMTQFGVESPSLLRNAGTIVKRAGEGTSVVQADYVQEDTGSVRVLSGTLALPSGVPAPAEVRRGRSYGTGACYAPGEGCEVSTFGAHEGDLGTLGADLSSATLTVPGATQPGSVGIVVDEKRAKADPGDLTGPVLAHAGQGLSATRSDPAVLTLRFDERLLDGRSWGEVQVFRQATRGKPFVRLPACRDGGAPPRGSVACVDRRGIPGVSSKDVFDDEGPGSAPDVVMVVRTTGTSRWVAR